MSRLNHVGPGRVHLDPPHVGDDQQWRILQRPLVELQLLQRGGKISMPPLVLPCEAASFPHVGPAVTAAGLRCALLEGKPFAFRIGGDGVRVPKDGAQIVEMRLRRAPFRQFYVAPFGNEVLWRHPCPRLSKPTKAGIQGQVNGGRRRQTMSAGGSCGWVNLTGTKAATKARLCSRASRKISLRGRSSRGRSVTEKAYSGSRRI